MGNETKTDLPRVKSLPSAAKVEKVEKPKKVKADKVAAVKTKPAAEKAEKPKKEKAAPAKATAKKETKASTKKAPAKAAKPAKSAAKAAPAKAAPAGKKSKVDISADAIAARLIKAQASGSVAKVKVDYASAATVVDALIEKAVTFINKTYSDKAVSNVSEMEPKLRKAVAETLKKNANDIRKNITTAASKKVAAVIVKAAKQAEAGKLTAASFKEFDVTSII